MRYVLPCLLFLAFPAHAGEPPFCEDPEATKALCASPDVAPFLDCPPEAPCEQLEPGANGARRVEIINPPDAPEGWREQIMIVE